MANAEIAKVNVPTRVQITEDWLRAVGFKWSQIERQPSKHWILWIAQACIDPRESNGRLFCDGDDLGIEVAENTDGSWFCWVRSDVAHRYARFLHVRHLAYQDEVIRLIEALTGRMWNPADVLYGNLHAPEVAARMRREAERLDQRLGREWGARVERECGLDPAKREIVRA